MDEQKYIDDLKDIKEIMDKSSRFISLSGWSGVSAGILALIAAYIAHNMVLGGQGYGSLYDSELHQADVTSLIGLAIATLVVSIGAGIFFTTRTAKKNNQKLWDFQTKRLLINLLIPLVAGGLLCLILLFKGYIILVAPLTLIFYGLSLVNASKYTLNEIRGLGFIEIFLGLLATCFTGYGLIFWAIGFGIMHIIYGVLMQMKYGS